MESDNIHDQMAQYDFKAPVKVTMIFEENEDDELIELSTIKLENSHNVEKEKDNCNISGSIDINEIDHKTNIELTQISPVAVQENSKGIASKAINDSSKEITFKNVDESITENIDNTLKRKTENEYDRDINSKIRKSNNKENPKNLGSIPNNTGESNYLINNEDLVSNFDGNNNNKHLNDLDNTTLTEINAKIFIELLNTVSEHLLIIIKEHHSFLQFQNDKCTNLYTLDNLKHSYLRLKYHYFDLSYCTVSTILLPLEKNAGFIGRFLNHTLQLSKNKGINCTYNILETLYFEMIHWAKVKKKHLTSFPSNVSSHHNENIMLKQQLLIPPKKIPLHNSGDINNSRQIQNTCIFSSGPVGRQVKISVVPSLIQQNSEQLNHGTSVTQKNRQLNYETLSVHHNKQNISDKSSLVHQIEEPLSVEPSSNDENSLPSIVEPLLTHQKPQEINPEPSLIHQNVWNISSEPSIQQWKKQQSTTELSSYQQNRHLNYDESPFNHQNTQQINSVPSLICQNKQQNNFKQTDSLIQQNIQHNISPVQSPIHQLNKQQLYNEPWPFQQNNQLLNVEPSITHLNSAESSLIQQKRKPNKTPLPIHQTVIEQSLIHQNRQPHHQTIPQTAVEQPLIHQNRQTHPKLQSPGTFMKDFRNNNKNVMQPNQCVNFMSCNFSHYNPLSYPTNGRHLQQHPYNRYHPPNVFPNYGTAPRGGLPPPNYEDTMFRQYYNDQLRHPSPENYNQEPVTQNPDIDTTRSSVSKDSGIMSPLFTETTTDQLSLPLIEDINLTPLITHVTSLNPNAAHIIEGKCTVCQKPTNSKCLGCLKCYYCGHECQTKDWDTHKYICRTAGDTY